jgi:hypothetical protein
MLTRLLLIASLPLVLGADADNWKPFTSKEGGFTILFPGVPAESKQEAKAPTGTVTVTFFVAEQGGVTYIAGFSVFSKETMKSRTEQKRLNNARDGAVAAAKGNLKEEKRIHLAKKYPGRELLIQAEKGFIRSRIYAVENRLYQTMVMGTKQQTDAKEATDFLDSFRLKYALPRRTQNSYHKSIGA